MIKTKTISSQAPSKPHPSLQIMPPSTMGITPYTYPPSSSLQNTLSFSPLSLSNRDLTSSLTTGCLLELVTFGTSMSYTSLRDLIPPPPVSQSFPEIPIKNRLVKQAAWAYLQPMSASPEPDDTWFSRRLCVRCDANCVTNQFDGCLGFLKEQLLPVFRRAIDCAFGRFRGRVVSREL